MKFVNEENFLTILALQNPAKMQREDKYLALSNVEFSNKKIFEKFMKLFYPELDLRYIIDVEQKIKIIKSSTLKTLEISNLFIYLKSHEVDALMNGTEFYTDEIIYELIRNYYDRDINKISYPQQTFTRNIQSRLRYILPPSNYQTILRIANCNETFIKNLINTTNKEIFYDKICNLSNHNRNIVILSSYMFPKGGGEQYTWEQVILLSELGYSVIWISEFSKDLKTKFRIEKIHQNYIALKPEYGKMIEEIEKTVSTYNPGSVIMFGHEFSEWKRIIENKSIRVYIFHHFWTYWINYYPNMNIDMDSKLNSFQYRDINLDSNTIHLFPNTRVAEICMRGRDSSNIQSKIIPAFPIEIYEKQELSEGAKRTVFRVVMVNSRANKGGKKLLEIATKLRSGIEFIVYNNEQDPDDTEDHDLLSQLQNLSNVEIINEYHSSKDIFANIDLTIVPSVVEETYGRVFFESIAKDVPCLVSFESIKNVGISEKYDFILTKKDDWVENILMLKNDDSKLSEILEIQKSLYNLHSRDRLGLVNEIHSFISSEKSKRVGIFSLWKFQGLGKLTKHYYEALSLLGYEVFVFAYKPYFEQFDKELDLASDRFAGKRIYQSYNTREQVPTSELINFIRANKIKVLIVPEICFQINWSRLQELHDLSIEIISIPMIEIVRSDELMLHNGVHKNWMLTEIGMKLFKESEINNTIRIRYRPLKATRL